MLSNFRICIRKLVCPLALPLANGGLNLLGYLDPFCRLEVLAQHVRVVLTECDGLNVDRLSLNLGKAMLGASASSKIATSSRSTAVDPATMGGFHPKCDRGLV